MMTAVDAVLFDLDETLCDYRRSASDVLAIAFDREGVEPFFEIYDYYGRFDEFVEAGDDIRDVRRRCFSTLADESGYGTEVGRTVAEAFTDERDQTNVQFLPGAERAFEHIREHYEIAIVTNGDPWMQSQKLAGLGIADQVETVIHGGHDAPYKPDPEPFHVALSKLGVDADRAIHVGNSLESDVAGAHNAGVRSVWLDGMGPADPDPTPHYRITSMGELVEEPWA